MQRRASESSANRFVIPLRYDLNRNGAVPSGSMGKSTLKNGQFRPAVYTNLAGLPHAKTTTLYPYDVSLPDYNFATRRIERRLPEQTLVMQNRLKTQTYNTKPLSMSQAYPVAWKSGTNREIIAAPLPSGGHSSTEVPQTAHKQIQKKVDVHQHTNDLIDKTVKLARQQAEKCLREHPQRPASAVPCERVPTSSVITQRTRHRSTDADAIPRKARKKHTKHESRKRTGLYSSDSPTLSTTTHIFTRRVSGQYPERIKITNKPVKTLVMSQSDAADKSRFPKSLKVQTVTGLPSYENLRPCLPGASPHQSSKLPQSTPTSSCYSTSVDGSGPRVFKVDSVIPSTEPFLFSTVSIKDDSGYPCTPSSLNVSSRFSSTTPVLPDCMPSVIPTNHSTVDASTEQPLDYSMKTLKNLESALKPPVLDLSLPKQESTVMVAMPPATEGTVASQFYIPPVVSEDRVKIVASAYPSISQIATSLPDSSNVDEAVFVRSQLPDNVISTASVNPQCSIVHQTVCIPYQVDTSNLSTLCDVALSTTSSEIFPADERQRNSRKKRIGRKEKKSASPAMPKTRRKTSQPRYKNRQTEQPYVVSLYPYDTGKLDDSTPSKLDMTNAISNPANAAIVAQIDKNELTASVEEVQVSGDESTDSTLDADERLDTTLPTNEVNTGLSENDGPQTLPTPEAAPQSKATVEIVPQLIGNDDGKVALEKNDEQSLGKQTEESSRSDVAETTEKVFVKATSITSKEECVKTFQSNISTPNVSILRFSNEMRTDFSVSSQDGVTAVRRGSLMSIMKAIKTDKVSSSQESLETDKKRLVEHDNQAIDGIEISSPKQDAIQATDANCSEVAAILNSNPDNNPTPQIKSEFEEVRFLPTFSCHSPIDLNEACCDEYDNMCRDFDVRDCDCLEIVPDSSEIRNTKVEPSEKMPNTQTGLDRTVNEMEFVFSPSPADEVSNSTAIVIEEVAENSQVPSKRKKSRRVSRTKRKVLAGKTAPSKEVVIQKCSAERLEPSVLQEVVSEEIPPVTNQSIVESTAMDSELLLIADNSVNSAENLGADVEISPSKRKSLKLGYSLNSEFGIGDLRPKRRKLIKKDEKPIIFKTASPAVIRNPRPICLFDSSESSDDESIIFKTEKAKKLVKKSHIQQKSAMKESQKILKKAKHYLVKKEPKRLLKKSSSRGKPKGNMKSPSTSLCDARMTPISILHSNKGFPAMSSGPSLGVNKSRQLRPNGSRFVLSRGYGLWQVTRRETLLLQQSLIKNESHSCSDKDEAPSDESDIPMATIQLKSFVRDRTEPEDHRKVADEPQNLEPIIYNNGNALHQTIATSLENKMAGNRNALLGMKSFLAAKTSPTISKLIGGLSRVSKSDVKASKENFDPDQRQQLKDNKYVVNSAVDTNEVAILPFSVSPNESYGEEDGPQPFVLTTFAKDVSQKDMNAEHESDKDFNSSVVVKSLAGASLPRMLTAIQHCEFKSLDNDSPNGSSVQSKVIRSTSKQDSTVERNRNEIHSPPAQHITANSVGCDAKERPLLSPPSQKQFISSSCEANKLTDDVVKLPSLTCPTGNIYSLSSIDKNSDVTLRVSVTRASSNANNNNVFDSLHEQIAERTIPPPSSCTAETSTSVDHDINSDKKANARMKGNWTSRDFATTDNATRPPYFERVRLSYFNIFNLQKLEIGLRAS